jgi:hypothetical protein
MAFLFLLTIPLLIAIGFFIFSDNQVTLKEFLLHVLIQCVIAGTSMAIIYHANVSDTEILNGTITGKARTKVSCEHSYSCNCYESCSGSGLALKPVRLVMSTVMTFLGEFSLT